MWSPLPELPEGEAIRRRSHPHRLGHPKTDRRQYLRPVRAGRLGYRMWATKTGGISPSVEDSYDHDVGEFMV